MYPVTCLSSDHPLMEWAIAQAKLHISWLFSRYILCDQPKMNNGKITRLGIQINLEPKRIKE